MADDSDKASELEELQRTVAIMHKKPAAPKYTGKCHNCSERLTAFHRWCDSDCRRDWERLQHETKTR